MPWGLHRYQQTGDLHFVTFSCYRRMQLLDPPTRRLFERGLEAARRKYCLRVIGYVVMPEHVHLLVSEPEDETLAVAVGAMKQSVSRRRVRRGGHFWQPRYYDFNVWTEKKRIEKLRYIHRNPVTRGLVQNPEDRESTPPHARAARGGGPRSEQLPTLPDGKARYSRDRIAVGGPGPGASGLAAASQDEENYPLAKSG